MPGVTVRITGPNTERTTVTDPSGKYSFTGLTCGVPHDLTIVDGIPSSIKGGVQLKTVKVLGNTITANVPLGVAPATAGNIAYTGSNGHALTVFSLMLVGLGGLFLMGGGPQPTTVGHKRQRRSPKR